MTYLGFKRYSMVNSSFAMLIICLISMTDSLPDDGLCSQVYQMHEYCTRQVTLLSNSRPDHAHAGRVGKAGPRGPPGIVNYTKIEQEMQKKFNAMEIRFKTKMTNIEEKMLNNTSEIERKFSELIRVAQELRPLTFSDCGKVTKNDAKIWNETGGVFDIYPSYSKLEVFCDLTTDGGGWMVFQRRSSGSTDFYRTWNEYVNGFGNKDDEFWFGLENLHRLTRDNDYELRIDLEDWEGNRKYAKYSNFKVGGPKSKYALTVGGYTGDAGDSLSGHNGHRFSTKDQDNDIHSGNCAVSFKGAWWYTNCHASNLNGHYFQSGVQESFADGLVWRSWKEYYYSLKFTEMKIRPI